MITPLIGAKITPGSVTVQIGATASGGSASVYTLDISKDKRSDGSFGELYGHVMYQDPILPENIK